MQKQVKINNDVVISNDLPFVLIAGPCQVEDLDHSLFMAEKLMKITDKLNIPFVYKSSFDKANRTSIKGKRGAGLDESVKIFENIKKEFKCPILTDVHNESQSDLIRDVVDIIQIPALLCRQTDLLESAAKTKKAVNVKKGQFVAPSDMKNVVEKLEHFGSKDILLTERGTSFGYNNLVNDMRGLKIMSDFGYPVIFDATHSVQSPSGLGGSSGGFRQYVPTLSYSAIATKIAGIFMEVHQDPDNAPSDGPCMVILDELEEILIKIKAFDTIAKEAKVLA
jgi:2-dehydro-3-deoxyphosphooctonate aldolase (KDO 8-P synthase)